MKTAAARSLTTDVGPKVLPSDSYGTPGYILDAARAVGPLGLDPFDRPGSLTAARVSLQLQRGENGLTAHWHQLVGKGEIVWVNGPYSAGNLPLWVAKCGLEARHRTHPATVIALVPVDTSTDWFHEILDGADAVCFLRRRVRHHLVDGTLDGSPRFASAVPYWGRNPLKFEIAFERLGRVLHLGPGR